MGGLFSPPSPPSPPPPLPVIDDGAGETKRRLEAIARRRRGRSGTIVTSARGVRGLLTAAAAVPKRKSLLGE